MNLLRRKWPFFGDHGRPPAVYPPTFGAWGKLPVFGDYQGWPAQAEFDPAATRYTNWIKKGWEAVRDIIGQTAIVPHRLWCRWNQGECLTAEIWQSRDSISQSMTRPFPFSCFVTETDVSPSWPARIARISSIWQTLGTVRTQLAQITGAAAFEQVCKQAERLLNVEDPSAQRHDNHNEQPEISLRTFGQAILGTVDDENLRQWLTCTHRFLRDCSAQATAQNQLAIACPTAASLPLGPQLQLWLQWLSAAMTDNQPYAILTPAGQGGDELVATLDRIVICFRELADVDLLLFTLHASEYACLKAIDTTIGQPVKGSEEVCEPTIEPDTTLSGWLAAQESRSLN